MGCLRADGDPTRKVYLSMRSISHQICRILIREIPQTGRGGGLACSRSLFLRLLIASDVADNTEWGGVTVAEIPFVRSVSTSLTSFFFHYFVIFIAMSTKFLTLK